MKNLNEKLDQLFCEWMQEAENNGDCNFVCDGVMNGYNDWTGSDKRIVFVGKDPHFKNVEELEPGVLHGEDYRTYDIKSLSTSERFWRNILAWTNGIMGTIDVPFAFVNIKKEAGFATVSNGTLKKYAHKYKSYLKRQIQDILSPNIIVCCGTSGVVMECIYDNEDFQKLDDDGFVWYSKASDLLLIATYHPTNRLSNERMYNDTVGAYSYFVNMLNKGI